MLKQTFRPVAAPWAMAPFSAIPAADPAAAASPMAGPAAWDQRHREGSDGWELGRPAPPLEAFLRDDTRSPQPPGQVLVPGCGRGHEAALLAELGFAVVGLDFSGEALAAAGLGAASLDGVVEHTCFCAIDPSQRPAYLARMHQLLVPGGWLLGLFWCHPRPGGPPWGSDAAALEQHLRGAGFRCELWEPARGSVASRQDEWLGLWRRQP